MFYNCGIKDINKLASAGYGMAAAHVLTLIYNQESLFNSLPRDLVEKAATFK